MREVKKINLTKFGSIIIIIVSVIVSWLIANIAVYYENDMELITLINLLFPILLGLSTFLLFLLLDWAYPKIRFWTTIIFVMINIIAGIQIRVDCSCS